MTTAPITNITTAAKPVSVPYVPLAGKAVIKGLAAPKVLLMGAPGTGKTTSIATLLEAGLEVFVIITEPNGLPNLLNALKTRNIPLTKLHWKYISPMAADFSSLEEMTKLVNIQSYSALADLKAGIGKSKSNQIMLLLNAMRNFHDDRTDLFYGDVTTWGYDRALVLDSLSGLNMLAIQNTVGLKPTMHQGEWGVAMNLEETYINKLTSDMAAYFVLLAHIDRNVNEATAQTIVTPSAIGAKLGPRIGRFFSEVVLACRVDAKFTWSTSEASTDVKQSTLPIKKDMLPSFMPIVKSFEATLVQMRS